MDQVLQRWRREESPNLGRRGGGHWEEEIVTALPIMAFTAIWSHGPKACKMYV